jgi:hypothetical protein
MLEFEIKNMSSFCNGLIYRELKKRTVIATVGKQSAGLMK